MSQDLDVTGGPAANEATIRLPNRAPSAGDTKTVSLKAQGHLSGAEPGCRVETEGADLLVRVPAHIASRFETDVSYQLEIPELGINGHVDAWPRLPVKQTVMPSRTPPPSPEPTVDGPAHVPPRTVTRPAEQRPTPAPSKSKWLLPVIAGVAGLLLVIAVLVLLHFFGNPFHHAGAGLRLPSGDNTAAPAAIPAPPPRPTTNAAHAPNGGQSGDPFGQLSVPDVIARASTPAQIGSEGVSRLSNGRADDGILLLESAASRGDAASMATLAHAYDPVGFDPKGPIPSPDVREAAQYYQAAAKAGDTSVSTARQALHDRLAQQAQAGDMTAQTALQDFWP